MFGRLTNAYGVDMANVNKVILIGNVTRDVESKALPSGSSLASLSLAVNRSYKTESGEKREEVTFVDVELWGRVAEIAAQYVKKGSPLYVEGRLKMDSWEDKETGQKRSKMKVVGEAIQLLGSKKDAADEVPYAPKPRPVVESGEADEIPF